MPEAPPAGRFPGENESNTMRTQVDITITESSITIGGPFCAKNNAKYRSACGRFTGGVWAFPNTKPGRSVVEELFGCSEELTAVKVRLHDNRVWVQDGQAGIAGYVIAERRSRDNAVRLADGVTLTEGRFLGSGGSAKSPRVTFTDDAEVEVIIRKDMAERLGFLAPAAVPDADPIQQPAIDPAQRLRDAAPDMLNALEYVLESAQLNPLTPAGVALVRDAILKAKG